MIFRYCGSHRDMAAAVDGRRRCATLSEDTRTDQGAATCRVGVVFRECTTHHSDHA